ncbi:MAG: HPr family phosphocarrier protein [Victivallales bacterium]|nr:HPr family phosphocarrier protein [Victivallales bacterium]
MVTKTGIVHNKNGIHCRPAEMIAKKTKGYAGTVSIVNGNGLEANTHSVLSILRLGLIEGDSFTVSVDGPDEEKVCNEMLALLEKPFDCVFD